MRVRKDISLGQGCKGMDSQKRALSVRGAARVQGRAKVGWQMEQHVQWNRDSRRPHKTGNWVPSGGSGLKCEEKENMWRGDSCSLRHYAGCCALLTQLAF